MRKLVLCSPHGGSSDAAIIRSRIGRVATASMLVLLLSTQVWGGAEAKTRLQCEKDSQKCNKGCNESQFPTSCTKFCVLIWKQCECDAGDKSYCDGGTNNPKSSDVTPPKKVPQGPGSVGTPPKSDTSGKPQGPGSVGTPPKSNPTTPVKPKSPGNVTAPKSNSSSGSGGPILRSGNSGNSNSNNSDGGGRSGSSKR